MTGRIPLLAALLSCAFFPRGAALAQAPSATKPETPRVIITIDAQRDRHAINPLIYGVAHASAEQLEALQAPLHRSGGNTASRYNWQANADNRAADWYFESIASEKAEPGERADNFLGRTKAAGALAMWTIPLLDWIARTGPQREKLGSFPVSKYGAQQKADPYAAEWGNGRKPDGSPLQGNDPHDANTRNSPAFQREFVQYLTKKWGRSAQGGVRYFLMDNEPGLWHSTHRDVQPHGVKMRDLVEKTLAYAAAVKSVDPGALVAGPEEWGWTGYFNSAFDAQTGAQYGWNKAAAPDRKSMGGRDAMPWYLEQMRAAGEKAGRRVLDVFTVHIYPQGGEFGHTVTPEMQLRRNRSTRALWDPAYRDDSWIADTVKLIPRLKDWVATSYPQTPIGITEYNWGAEDHINGATAQADIFGIFGRENLDLAARWTTPDPRTPTFKAMQLFRNYDGQKSGFGDVSVSAQAPNADELSAFAAVRLKDGALTVMIVNKKLATAEAQTAIALNLKNFWARGGVQAWQLTAANRIVKLPDSRLTMGQLLATVPDGSVTLFVVPKT